jgi:hypothetical protein
MATAPDVQDARPASRDVLRLGLIAAPGPTEQLAVALAEELPALLAERTGADVAWDVPVRVEPLPPEPRRRPIEMVQDARSVLRDEDWDLAIYLTDLPLKIGRRPVIADASAQHGVGLVSLPALGAVSLQRRAREAIVSLVDALTGERPARDGGRDGHAASARRRRIVRRLQELASPVRVVEPEDETDLAYVAAVVRGHARVLAGMVRANQPWRLVGRLSRALVAALAAGAFGLAQSDIWNLSAALGPIRLTILTIASLAATVGSLIVAHGLWEHAREPRDRERVVLFNAATTATVVIGVLALYAVLFVLTLVGTGLVIDDEVLADSLGHPAGLREHVELAWMVSSVATVGGALGAALETDVAVRRAAYGRARDEGVG